MYVCWWAWCGAVGGDAFDKFSHQSGFSRSEDIPVAPAPSYDQTAYDQAAYDQAAYDQAAYSQAAYDQASYDQASYPS